MEIYHIDIHHLPNLNASAACIGYFDGMHIGHMKLVSEMMNEANKQKLKKALITFHPDPWVVLKNEKDIPHITSMEERIEIGKSLELDYWIILPFTKELSQMNTQKFEEMLYNLNVKSLICGFDYSYGYKGQGNIQTLRKQSYFDVIEVNSVTYRNEKISSTRIEKEIKNGNIHNIKPLLGRYYSIKGNVIKGSHLGNTIGFPTANITPTYHSIIPKAGVYIGLVKINGQTYKSMINIGHNPTFNYQDHLSIEAHILDFDSIIYNQEIEVTFIERIRDEIKFNSKEALIKQLNIDLEITKRYEYKPSCSI